MDTKFKKEMMNEETTSPNKRGAVSQFFLRLSQVILKKNFHTLPLFVCHCSISDNDFFLSKLSFTDLSRLVRQVDTIHKNTMGSVYRIDFTIFAKSVSMPRLVHRYICLRNLPFKFIYCVFNAKNRSSIRFGR